MSALLTLCTHCLQILIYSRGIDWKGFGIVSLTIAYASLANNTSLFRLSIPLTGIVSRSDFNCIFCFSLCEVWILWYRCKQSCSVQGNPFNFVCFLLISYDSPYAYVDHLNTVAMTFCHWLFTVVQQQTILYYNYVSLQIPRSRL